MITIPAGVRVLLATRPVDFRKGAHSLAALAAELLGEDPFSGVVLVFRAKRGDRVKIVHWDSSGLVLVWKHLEGSSFRWPPITDGTVRLSAVQFAALFAGLDFSQVADARQIPTPTAVA
jgi:transposase